MHWKPGCRQRSENKSYRHSNALRPTHETEYRMSNAEQSLKRINDKLQQVAQRYQSLQKENQQLTREIRVFKEREESREKKIIELELKIAAIKTATGRLDDSEKKEIDKRLNHYIREIDRCIALLSD